MICVNKSYKYLNKTEIIKSIITEIKSLNDKEQINNLLYCYNINNSNINEYFNFYSQKESISKIKNYITDTKDILDKTIYSQNNVKREIQRIISGWITGKNDGYCIGFEGPPGVGKTTIAKYGISKCFKDEKNNCRP